MNKDFVSREKLDEVVADLTEKMEANWENFLDCGYGGYEEVHDAYEDAINKLLEVMNES